MITQFFFPHVGGVEKHVLQVARELVARGDELDIITWRYDDHLPVFEILEGLKIHRILDSGWQKKNLRRLRGWVGTGMLMEVWKGADVIHFHDYTPLIEWYLPYLAVNRRTYITFHGYEGYPVPRLSILLRRLAGTVTKGAICAGGFIEKYYGTACSSITYGGVSNNVPERSPEREGALFVGGLRKDVGIIGYLCALSILKEKYGKNLKLTVVGDGPLKEEVLTLAREKGVELEFIGMQEDPSPFLARAQLALSDSYLVILEAMASEVPVFSYYDNPLKKDYLLCFPGSGEILGIRDDPEKLAMDLAGFLNDPGAYANKVERASVFAREQTWARVAEMYGRLYAG